MEEAVRKTAGFRDSLYVITGPLYEGELKLPKADEPHQVPSGYFKIVYNSKGEAAAFMMDQTTPWNMDFCEQ